MTQELGKELAEPGGRAEGIDRPHFIAGGGRRLLGYTTPSECPTRPCSVSASPWASSSQRPIWLPSQGARFPSRDVSPIYPSVPQGHDASAGSTRKLPRYPGTWPVGARYPL